MTHLRFVSSMAAQMLAALALLAAQPTFADVLFDNLDPNTGNNTALTSSFPPYYTDKRLANRIPVSTPIRITRVTMDVEYFHDLQVQVCETAPSGTIPDASRCATFTPDSTSDGRRVLSVDVKLED